MKSTGKRKKLSGPSTTKEERAQLKKWEVVYVDTSGKFQVKSARGCNYYSVFLTRSMARKLLSVTLRSGISKCFLTIYTESWDLAEVAYY
jgi:hypothetical protein